MRTSYFYVSGSRFTWNVHVTNTTSNTLSSLHFRSHQHKSGHGWVMCMSWQWDTNSENEIDIIADTNITINHSGWCFSSLQKKPEGKFSLHENRLLLKLWGYILRNEKNPKINSTWDTADIAAIDICTFHHATTVVENYFSVHCDIRLQSIYLNHYVQEMSNICMAIERCGLGCTKSISTLQG